MTLEEELDNHDLNAIYDSMTAYAYNRLKSIDIKDLEGRTPEDFVSEVFMKVIDGKRDWENAKAKEDYSLKKFLFGCLKSHISNFLEFLKKRNVYTVELSNQQIANVESQDILEEKLMLFAMLKSMGADQNEIDIFECWLEEINKPAEIVDLLGVSIKEVNNIFKRLKRKIPIIQTQIRKYL